MDNMGKLRILLQHWIEHNGGHTAEFEKWRGIMAEDDHPAIVEYLEQASERMGKVSAILQEALDALGGPTEKGGEHHHHHHH